MLSARIFFFSFCFLLRIVGRPTRRRRFDSTFGPGSSASRRPAAPQPHLTASFLLCGVMGGVMLNLNQTTKLQGTLVGRAGLTLQ